MFKIEIPCENYLKYFRDIWGITIFKLKSKIHSQLETFLVLLQIQIRPLNGRRSIGLLGLNSSLQNQRIFNIGFIPRSELSFKFLTNFYFVLEISFLGFGKPGFNLFGLQQKVLKMSKISQMHSRCLANPT